MRYVMLVSHGTFAPGLHDALKMLAGEDREDVISTSLENGMGSETYTENVRRCISKMTEEDEVILLGDLMGGSPLTMAANILSEKGMLKRSVVIGGVNLPLALSAVLMKDTMEFTELAEMLMPEARDEIKQFNVSEEAEEDI